MAAREIYVDVKPVSCPDCGGNGVKLGPYNDKTRKRDTSWCSRCDGWGILFRKAAALYRRFLYAKTLV